MHVETQKSIAIYLSYFLTFCVSLDSGVFLPTLLECLHILQILHDEAILGLAIAGYSLMSGISARLMRHLAEQSWNVRLLLTICCSCYITGGFVYTYATSWWGVIFGRMFCGFGSGAIFVIDSDISSNTLAPELSQLQKHLKLSLIFGWILSPIFSMILTSMNSNPMSFGLLSATVFMVSGIFTVIGWFDVGKTLRYSRLRQNLTLAYERGSYGAVKSSPSSENDNEEEGYARICGLSWSSIHSSPTLSQHRPSTDIENKIQDMEPALKNSCLTESDEILEKAEGLMGAAGDRKMSSNKTQNYQRQTSEISTSPGDGLISAEVDYTFPRLRCCHKQGFCFHFRNSSLPTGAPFLTGFIFGSLQTMLTPLTYSFFDLGSTENAVIQLVLALIAILPTLSLRSAAQKVLYISGCTIAALSSGWLIVMLCPPFNLGYSLPAFCAGLLGTSFACGLLFGATPAEFPRSWVVCGLVIGSVWAGATLALPRLLLGGQITVIIIVLAAANIFTNI